MGFLDWLKKRRSPSKPLVEAKPPERERGSTVSAGNLDIKRVLAELETERKRNIDQERKITEMEDKFSVMQKNWMDLMEKQQDALERMMKNTGEGEEGKEKKLDEKEVQEDAINVSSFSNPILVSKTFTNFVVDDANRFPYLAAEAVATGVGRRYNPLFIYGPVGVGKTHLLHAIANRVKEMDKGKSIIYSSTEKFTDELLKALEKDNLDVFRSKYRNIDFLLIDDIQMLSGREATQKEFFHMFNHLYNSGKQIVLCSDRPPIEIKELEERLKSRFEGGLIIDINVPTFEGRRQILLNLSQEVGHPLSPEVLDYMAFYLDSSVRELEGGFNRVTAYASLMKEPVTVSLIRNVLEGVLLLRKDQKINEDDHSALDKREGMLENISVPKISPYSDLDLEEETDKLEQELLFELKKTSKDAELS